MAGTFRICLVAALAAVIVWAAPAAATTFTVEFVGEARSERLEAVSIDGVPHFKLADVARVAGVSRHWNPLTSKMTLSVGSRRLSLEPGSQFASLDGEAVNLARPIVRDGGSLWVPPVFLTDALGAAVNSDITVDPSASTVTLTRRGALVQRVAIEDLPDGTSIVLDLNDVAEFAARSRERGRIDVFMQGAAVADTLSLPLGVGLVSSVSAEQTEAGIQLVVRTTPAATSYSAELRSAPYRLEIVVEAEREEDVPSPQLRAAKQLAESEAPDLADDGIATVMVDPGHGGTDTGHVTADGLAEKDASLAVAEELARYLQREGFYVFMTRSSDSFVPLKRRAEIANLAGADLFLSVHCGAWHSDSADGFRVSYYRPDEESSPDAGNLGTRGLRRVTAQVRVRATTGVRWGTAQEKLVNESRALARAIHGRMAGSLDGSDRGIGAAELTMLSGCSMPAVLVETAFISNAAEASLLEDRGFRRNVARAIAEGIADHRDATTGRNE